MASEPPAGLWVHSLGYSYAFPFESLGLKNVLNFLIQEAVPGPLQSLYGYLRHTFHDLVPEIVIAFSRRQNTRSRQYDQCAGFHAAGLQMPHKRREQP